MGVRLCSGLVLGFGFKTTLLTGFSGNNGPPRLGFLAQATEESLEDTPRPPPALGQLYPGFVRTDPRFCEACEQLRRGSLSCGSL